MAGKQRRHFFRVETDIAASGAVLDGPGASTLFEARVLNVSAGGAWLELPVPLEDGQLLRLALRSEDPLLDLHARARVVHQNDGHAGVEFVDIDARSRAIVTRFVFAQAQRLGVKPEYAPPGSVRAA